MSVDTLTLKPYNVFHHLQKKIIILSRQPKATDYNGKLFIPLATVTLTLPPPPPVPPPALCKHCMVNSSANLIRGMLEYPKQDFFLSYMLKNTTVLGFKLRYLNLRNLNLLYRPWCCTLFFTMSSCVRCSRLQNNKQPYVVCCYSECTSHTRQAEKSA